MSRSSIKDVALIGALAVTMAFYLWFFLMFFEVML